MLTIFSQVNIKSFKSNISTNIQSEKEICRKWNFCLFKSTVVQLMSSPYGVSETLENAGVNNFLLRLSMETNK